MADAIDGHLDFLVHVYQARLDQLRDGGVEYNSDYTYSFIKDVLWLIEAVRECKSRIAKKRIGTLERVIGDPRFFTVPEIDCRRLEGLLTRAA